tara:strand:+ start:283 stop:819 length:537 start_codon:yes stop_codon:yes gene_type:complete
MFIFKHFEKIKSRKKFIFKQKNAAMDENIRLKFVRKKLGLTQESFAKSIGLNRGKVTSLEIGNVKISTLHALAIEYVHGINKNWLLNGEEPIFVKGVQSPPKKVDSSNEDKTNLHEVKMNHQNIISRFKNREMGLQNNEYLIGIEHTSEELYKKVSEYIKTNHEAAKIIKEEERKKIC